MEEISDVVSQNHPLLDNSETEMMTVSNEDCCIFEVPSDIRQANPQAYTPQMVLIGPLHHAKKKEALQIAEENCTTVDMERIKHRFKQYQKMEKMKEIYYQSFCERVGADAVATFRNYIEKNEKKIRRCYAGSTEWIQIQEFIHMIHLDAIFIVELMIRHSDEDRYKDDLVFKPRGNFRAIIWDLILLENQLPFFILEELASPATQMIQETTGSRIFRELTFSFFEVVESVSRDVKFKHLKHFTDLRRYEWIRNLKISPTKGELRGLCNVEKLQESGVDFTVLDMEGDDSINVRFENKRLMIPRVGISNKFELDLRNVIALEEFLYTSEAYVTNYVDFLNILIDTEKDVDILMQKGIIDISGGDRVMVAEIFNMLNAGTAVTASSYYHDIAEALIKHHKNPWNRSKAYLKHNYFDNVWKGTATVAGIILLIFSLIQTITSIIQVTQGQN